MICHSLLSLKREEVFKTLNEDCQVTYNSNSDKYTGVTDETCGADLVCSDLADMGVDDVPIAGQCLRETCAGKADPEADQLVSTERISFCHRTCDESNPWVRMTIDLDAWGDADDLGYCEHQHEDDLGVSDCLNDSNGSPYDQEDYQRYWGEHRADYLIKAHGTRAEVRQANNWSADGNDPEEQAYWFEWERACPYVRNGECCSWEDGTCCGAPQELEPECRQDVKLFKVENGVSTYTDETGEREEGVIYDRIPIVIESQNEEGSVKFQLNTNEFAAFFEDKTGQTDHQIDEVWIQYHSFVDGDSTKCMSKTNVPYPSSVPSETFTAKCMQGVPITVVSLWVVDTNLSAADDAEVDDCCRKPLDTNFPQPQPSAVQYTFLLHCETTCAPPSSSPTSLPSSRPTALPTKETSSPSSSPSDKPSPSPTSSPSSMPTSAATEQPTASPTSLPSISGEVCQNFAVHGRTAVTFSAIQTTITGGDLGIAPATGAAITGLVRMVNGVRFPGATPQEQEFATHATAAFHEAMAVRSDGNTLAAAPIGGKTFTPGTYRSAATISTAANEIVTLDGLNQANPVFIFQATSTLGTGAGSYFNLINGAKAENVLWAIGTAATLGANTVLPGTLLAGSAITVGAQGLVQGCVVAQTAVTFSSEGFVEMPGSARRTRQLRVRG
jgi:hypothetical protein